MTRLRTLSVFLAVIYAWPQYAVADEVIAPRALAEAWRENETRLESVELTYLGSHTSTTTERRHSVRMNLGDGVEITMGPSQYESRVIITSCPECSVINATSNEFSDTTNYFDGKDWIEYRLDLNRKVKRRFDQLAGQTPHDPRWEFTKFNSLPPEELLLAASSEESMRHATYIPESQIKGGRHNEVRLEFSPEFGKLPIASSLWMVDLHKQVETKISESTFQYCRIGNRNAYVPTDVKICYFQDGVVGSKTNYKLIQIELLDGGRNSVIAKLPQVSRLVDLTKD